MGKLLNFLDPKIKQKVPINTTKCCHEHLTTDISPLLEPLPPRPVTFMSFLIVRLATTEDSGKSLAQVKKNSLFFVNLYFSVHYYALSVNPDVPLLVPQCRPATSSNCNPNLEDMTSIRLPKILMFFNKRKSVATLKESFHPHKRCGWQKSLSSYVRLNNLNISETLFSFSPCVCLSPYSTEALEDGGWDESFAGHRYASPASGTQSNLLNNIHRSRLVLLSFLLCIFLHGSFTS